MVHSNIFGYTEQSLVYPLPGSCVQPSEAAWVPFALLWDGGGVGGSSGRPVELGQPVPLGALGLFTVPQLLGCCRLLCLAV